MNNIAATPVNINWNPDLSIYASESFLKSVGDEYGWIGGIDSSGKLRCILPYTIIRKAIFRMVRFRVETISLGEELDVYEEKLFLNSVIDYFSSSGADMIIPATNNTIFRTYPDGALAAPYGTFVQDLTLPEDVLNSKIYKDYRKKIRRAIKIGVQIRSGIEHLDIAYNLIVGTLGRSSRSFRGYNDFKSFVLGLGENFKVYVAEYEGIIQACMVVPFSNHSAYSLYSGTISEPAKGAMHLLQWEVIRQFHAIGVKLFNFTGVRIDPEKGSKQEGIMNFKMRFGGRLHQGYMWKYSFHKLKFAAYSLAVRFLRGGDIVDQECHKMEKPGA